MLNVMVWLYDCIKHMILICVGLKVLISFSSLELVLLIYCLIVDGYCLSNQVSTGNNLIVIEGVRLCMRGPFSQSQGSQAGVCLEALGEC